ncbi:hypothetical protein [Comamonas sp.]|uniref:hypothetical protein n=1 Tax=Comamonas sp. TaxID=34028 RepID=UPI0028AC6DC9|nr:hypothetical protein [Comamonas sp.]
MRFSDDIEQLQPDKTQTIADLREVLLDMSRTMHEHTGKPMRSVHAKSFGLLCGSIEVLPDLPSELAQGLFVRPGHYEVLGRFSTPPAEELDDRVSLPRAFSLKVLDVPGARLEGSEGDTTQDFLMVNSPTFGPGCCRIPAQSAHSRRDHRQGTCRQAPAIGDAAGC